MDDSDTNLGRVNEAIALVCLVVGAILIMLDGAPVLEIVVVLSIVCGGVSQWWALRKHGKEARELGNRLLLLVGVALIALGSF